MEGNEESSNAVNHYHSKITIIPITSNTQDNRLQSLTGLATNEIHIQHCLKEMERFYKENDAVILSNSIVVNRNKFDKNAILLYGVLVMARGKEETWSIVAIITSSYLKLENMSGVYYEKTLNEYLEGLGSDEASTAYYLCLTETGNYNRVLETLPSLATFDPEFLSINNFRLIQIKGFSKRKDDMHNMYEAVKKRQILNENVRKILMEDIEETLKSDMHEDLDKYEGVERLFLNVEDMSMKNVMKSKESEILTKNFDPCAISSESLSKLSATSSKMELYRKSLNEITRQNVSKKATKGTKELVNYVENLMTTIINQYIYPSKTASQIPDTLQTLTHLFEQKRTRTSAGNFSSRKTKYRHDRASQILAALETPNHSNEQKRTRTSAGNFTLRGTKIRHDRARTTAYSRRREQDSYRKTLMMQTLISLDQLRESLVNVKYPHYIWPSGHPLILSKLRQIELDFSSNEYLERLYSFVNGINGRHRTWNSAQIVRPEPMVSAGFSYDGEDDKVVCKSCGAISDVNDWSDDDEDYAFSKHREAVNGPCEFLRTFDGEAQSTQAERSLGVNTVQCIPKYYDGIFLLTVDDEKDSDKKLSICEMIEKYCKRLLRGTNLFGKKNFSL